ncbi:MAG TPA: TolC family protein [Gemmatimonadaceae bacterium]|nr:TolC family protein [Gemmatimonadaceae bacterium]
MSTQSPTIGPLGRRVAALALLVLAAVPARAQQPATPAPGAPLTLGDAARLAARQGASVEGARFRAEQADARVSQRRADLLPSLSGVALYNERNFNTATLGLNFPNPTTGEPSFPPNGMVVPSFPAWDMRARVSQTLFDVGAIARVRSAQTAANAAEIAVSDAGEQAAATAAAAYLRYLRAQADVEARGADSVLADSLLLIARELLRSGVGVALDVTRAEAQLAGTRAQLIASRNGRDRARLELLRALNLPVDAPLALADSLPALPVDEPPPNEAEAVEAALRTRPDLRVAEEQMLAAERQIGAIRAERLPTIGVFADDGVNGKNTQHLLGTYSWGVQLSLPIFDGLRREARIEEQQAAMSEIDVRRRDLRLQVATEVRGALLDLAAAREQVDAARERLRLAEQELAQSRDRFRAGVSGNADVITASLQLTGARTLVIDALTSYQAARVALARAQGTVTRLR